MTEEPLITVAERTEYRETSRAADVAAFFERLAAESDIVHLTSFGTSPEGRDMPLVVLSAHGAFSPETARRPVVLLLCNIHGGEVEGKEAAQMLAREIVRERPHVAERLTLLIVPVFNVDGNERISPENRRLDLEHRHGQAGPEAGCGTRQTSQQFDLNREYMNQVAPEMRRLTQAVVLPWRPDLTIDCHATNGSLHGYALTYSFPENPAAHPGPVAFVRDRLLPDVSRRVEAKTGLRTFHYGNYRLNDDPATGWATFSCLPRFGERYRGLTGRMAILLEAYSYLPFKERVAVTRTFVAETLDYVIEHAADVRRTLDEAEADTIRRGREPGDPVGIRWELGPLDDEIELWTSATERVRTRHYARWTPTLQVPRPYAYLFRAGTPNLADKLRDHGVRLERLDAPTALDVEVGSVRSIEGLDRGAYLNPGGKPDTHARCAWSRERREFEMGDYVVRTAQPLGNLVVYLLEPESDDGLVAWHYLDDDLTAGADAPIYRLPQPVELKTRSD